MREQGGVCHEGAETKSSLPVHSCLPVRLLLFSRKEKNP